MHDPNWNEERSGVSRRKVLGLSGAVVAGLVGSVALTVRDARASVSVDGLEVPDESFEAESITPRVEVTAGYDYDVGNSANVDAIAFELTVCETIVDSEELSTGETALSGETDLSGPITDAEAWSASDFEVEVGESVEQDVAVGLWFGVLDADGETLVDATATDTTMVRVSHPQKEEYVATVGGTGQVVTTGE